MGENEKKSSFNFGLLHLLRDACHYLGKRILFVLFVLFNPRLYFIGKRNNFSLKFDNFLLKLEVLRLQCRRAWALFLACITIYKYVRDDRGRGRFEGFLGAFDFFLCHHWEDQ